MDGNPAKNIEADKESSAVRTPESDLDFDSLLDNIGEEYYNGTLQVVSSADLAMMSFNDFINTDDSPHDILADIPDLHDAGALWDSVQDFDLFQMQSELSHSLSDTTCYFDSEDVKNQIEGIYVSKQSEDIFQEIDDLTNGAQFPSDSSVRNFSTARDQGNTLFWSGDQKLQFPYQFHSAQSTVEYENQCYVQQGRMESFIKSNCHPYEGQWPVCLPHEGVPTAQMLSQLTANVPVQLAESGVTPLTFMTDDTNEQCSELSPAVKAPISYSPPVCTDESQVSVQYKPLYVSKYYSASKTAVDYDAKLKIYNKIPSYITANAIKWNSKLSNDGSSSSGQKESIYSRLPQYLTASANLASTTSHQTVTAGSPAQDTVSDLALKQSQVICPELGRKTADQPSDGQAMCLPVKVSSLPCLSREENVPKLTAKKPASPAFEYHFKSKEMRIDPGLSSAPITLPINAQKSSNISHLRKPKSEIPSKVKLQDDRLHIVCIEDTGTATESFLSDNFSKFGAIKHFRMKTRKDGTSFAFVEYYSSEDALNAVNNFNKNQEQQFVVSFGMRRKFLGNAKYKDFDATEDASTHSGTASKCDFLEELRRFKRERHVVSSAH